MAERPERGAILLLIPQNPDLEQVVQRIIVEQTTLEFLTDLPELVCCKLPRHGAAIALKPNESFEQPVPLIDVLGAIVLSLSGEDRFRNISSSCSRR